MTGRHPHLLFSLLDKDINLEMMLKLYLIRN